MVSGDRAIGVRTGPLLALALLCFAYWPLLAGGLPLAELRGLEHWFFTPEQKNPLLALGIAGWMAWRRRTRLLEAPARLAQGTAAGLFAVGAALFAWSHLTGAAELLLPSLAANLLAFGAQARGRAGVRALALPACVLLLGLPVAAPLRVEWVWQLQQWTAQGTDALLRAGGFEFAREGLVLQRGAYRFTVIESCSGLRGIEILSLVALAVRELFAASGRRLWLLVAAAPALALALNVLRVAAVVLLASRLDPSASGPASEDHTAQGLAVLVAGTVALYLAGRALARSDSPEPPRSEGVSSALPLRVSSLLLFGLGGLGLVLPAFPQRLAPPARVELPDRRADWAGEDLVPDRSFVGRMPGSDLLYRRYLRSGQRGEPQEVVIFVGLEIPENPGLFSPKLGLPGPEWTREEGGTSRLWLLDREAELAVVSHGPQRALVYRWELRSESLLAETTRALLALDASPFRRERRRAVLRLATPLSRGGAVGRDWAKKALDRFIRDFRPELAEL